MRNFADRKAMSKRSTMLKSAWILAGEVLKNYANRAAGGCGRAGSVRGFAPADGYARRPQRGQCRSGFHPGFAGKSDGQLEGLPRQLGGALFLSQGSDAGVYARGPQL